MNQRELNELRRRFKPDRTAISKVYGCYVSSSRQIISYVDAPLGLLSQEEQEMYLNLLKKSLSGTLGRNLIDIEFSTRQVADSDEHRLLQTLRQTELQDPNARESLYRRIIDASTWVRAAISSSWPPTPTTCLTAAGTIRRCPMGRTRYSGISCAPSAR